MNTRICVFTNTGASDAFSIAWSEATSLRTNFVGPTNLVNFRNLRTTSQISRHIQQNRPTKLITRHFELTAYHILSYITFLRITKPFYCVLFVHVQWVFILINKTLPSCKCSYNILNKFACYICMHSLFTSQFELISLRRSTNFMQYFISCRPFFF